MAKAATQQELLQCLRLEQKLTTPGTAQQPFRRAA
jgi:hypothetical protein